MRRMTSTNPTLRRSMQIGELARRAGVGVQTIRFYERRGLLRKPPRSRAGYRIYTGNDLELLQLIRKARHFGFKLKEIRRIVHFLPLADECSGEPLLVRCGPRCATEIIQMCKKKLKEFDQQACGLRAARRELLNALRQFQAVRVRRIGTTKKGITA